MHEKDKKFKQSKIYFRCFVHKRDDTSGRWRALANKQMETTPSHPSWENMNDYFLFYKSYRENMDDYFIFCKSYQTLRESYIRDTLERLALANKQMETTPSHLSWENMND